MANVKFSITGEEETQKLGAAVASITVPLCQKLNKSILINLEGDLGAGKTTFSRGFILSCGYKDIVRSPTYTLVEPYDFDKFSIYHFDLYRLLDPDFDKTSVSLIEWPDKAQGVLPQPDITIYLSYADNSRNVEIVTELLQQDELDSIKAQF